MVIIDDFSKELCGGIHVHSTGDIGLFKIVSEFSVASGMRRIEALTGEEALKHVQETEEMALEIQQALNSPRKQLLSQVDRLKNALKDKENEAKRLRQTLAHLKVGAIDKEVKNIKGVSVLVQKVKGLDSTELREMADSLKQKLGSGIVILASTSDNRVFLVAAITADLTNRIKADDLIKEIAAMVGGGGGGRADFAQAGGTKPEQLDRALEKSYSILEKLIQ
jgi:alanyl-tRNA synthetase